DGRARLDAHAQRAGPSRERALPRRTGSLPPRFRRGDPVLGSLCWRRALPGIDRHLGVALSARPGPLHAAAPGTLRQRPADAADSRPARLLPALFVSSPIPSERLSRDRKSTRLNSSHVKISYAVFCL